MPGEGSGGGGGGGGTGGGGSGGPSGSDVSAILQYLYGINFGTDGDYTNSPGYGGDNIGPRGSKELDTVEAPAAVPDLPSRPPAQVVRNLVDSYSGLRAGREDPDPYTGARAADPFVDSRRRFDAWNAEAITAIRSKSLLASQHLLAENSARHCNPDRTTCVPPMRSDANESSVANEVQSELDQSYVAILNVIDGKGRVVGPTHIDANALAAAAVDATRSDEYRLGFQVNKLRDHPLEVRHSAVLTGAGHMAVGGTVAAASAAATYFSGGTLFPLGGAMGMATGTAQFLSGFTLAISGADSIETVRMSGQLDYIFNLTGSPAQLIFGTTGLVLSGGDVGVSDRFATVGGIANGAMSFRGDPSKLYAAVIPGVGTKAEAGASAVLVKNMTPLGSKAHVGSLPAHIPAVPNMSMAPMQVVPQTLVAEEAAVRFQESVRLAEATLRAHPHMIQQLGGTHTGAAVTLGQLGAATHKPSFARTLAGNAMEALVNEINVAHPATDAGFRQVGGAHKIDFVGWGKFEGLTFELTTEGAVLIHGERPYIQATPGAMVFTYSLPIF